MDFQVLAHRGEGGYRQYRIPAMGVTPSGRIIAIYDGRPDLDDLPSPVDLLIRFSDDNGVTWSPQEVFAKSKGILGFGDASIIIDPSFGKFGRVLVFAQETRLAGFFESGLGTNYDDPTVVQIALWISDDNGLTWIKKVITEQLKDKKTEGIFATSGMGTRITNGLYSGRLLNGFVLRRGADIVGAIAYSDDHGENWKLGAIIPNGNETSLVCLKDGSLLIHSRSTPYRLSGYSHDGGETITEFGPDLALPDPSDNGSLCSLSTGEIVCTHNHDKNLRRRTVAKISKDDGKNWQMAKILECDSSAYSTSCELSNGQIGILFERNGYTEIVFCRVNTSEFRAIEDEIISESDENGIEFTLAFRFVKPARLKSLDKNQSELHIMPKVDMSQWELTSRKEIGASAGLINGEPIYTSEELETILGPISPGLHVGDEMRFSGRFRFNGNGYIQNLTIFFNKKVRISQRELVKDGDEIIFLDVRHIVTREEVSSGMIVIEITWSGELKEKENDYPEIIGSKIERIFSTSTGSQLS